VNEASAANASPTVTAGRDLADLHTQIEAALALLGRLRRQEAETRSRSLAKESAPLQEANEQLVLGMLRAQTEAESAARDIAFRELTTELRLESQRLGEENRQIAEASRLKSQFLANMSHELRTPLNAIIGFSDLLRSGRVATTSTKYLEFLGHINASGQHLLEMVNDVLDLSKVASGKLQFHPEPIDLAQAIKEVVDMLRVAADRNGVVVCTEIEPGLNDLWLDRPRFKQVLSNYLSNAIKFSHDGGTVTVRARAEADGSLRVEVQDTGIGIATADQARLFAEFQQIDSSSSRRHHGTGLGLALTRLLVEAQGGSVGVRSTLDAGSTFHFILNARPAVTQ
jgi:signal transduction histidine kinase